MSGPVDVLAVLDEAQDWLYRSSESRGDDARAESVKQARVAVAELIEAGREMMQQDAVQRATHNTNPFMADAADKLMAALGKVGAK